MIFSGDKRRSIADQTGIIDFRFALSFDNTTGECIVGLSGTRDFHFQFKSGKIYDNGGNFVQSYSPQTVVNISGQLGQSSYDYSINSELIAMDVPIGTGQYSWLYIKPRNGNVDFDGFVRGRIPDYYADNAGKYFYQNYVVSGRLINLNPTSRFRIFDVEVLQPSSPYSVVGFTTGDIDGTGYISLSSDRIGLSDYVVPLLLRTNFGDVNLDFTVTGDYSVIPEIYLNVSPDTTNVLNQVAKNYLTEFAYFPTGAYLGIELEYVSGITGNIYFFKDQISDIQYRLLSGVLTGCGVLSEQITGDVSGLDPKTLIYEHGTGTGIISTNTLCPTGVASQDYSVKIYGLGEGYFETDYLASGFHSGMFSGVVPIQGGVLTIVGYNFTGTGDTPGVAVGVVPTGTGKAFVKPTGCLVISQTLNYDSDFYSGIISVQKAFEGPLSLPYSVLSVGFATGQFVSGRVDSSYALNFEQGLYTYTKFFSGLISGNATNTGWFEPSGCLEDTPITGIITGYFSVTKLLDCSATTGLPFIPVSGVPITVYDSQKRTVQPNRVVLVMPNEGFGTHETSYDALAGNYTRTKTSRMGATPSGDGFFYNPVGGCLSGDLSNKIWKESMPYTVDSGKFDSNGNSMGFSSTRMYLTGTGDIDGDISGAVDSGVLHFFISGSGTKAIALRGLTLGAQDQILRMVLYKDAIYYDSWESVSYSPSTIDYVDDGLEGTTDYDTIGISDLQSGYYSLYISARDVPLPVVYFDNASFTGCEASRNILITVKATGVFRTPICVNLLSYEELTAHSGVNYDPIYLQYDDPLLTACSGIGAGKAKRCPGICFERGVPADGYWPEEERTYTFTIPIYDNGSFGIGHEFNISLSDPSGCNLAYPSEATVRIEENDNLWFVTGGGPYETGFVSGVELDCTPLDEVAPIFDECFIHPDRCDPCFLIPANCQVDEEACTGGTGCCSCTSTTLVTTTCPGHPGVVFKKLVPTPGSICGQLSANGCGPTPDYVYIGKMCCSGCGNPISNFAGQGLRPSFLAFNEDCALNATCAGESAWTNCTGAGLGCSASGSAALVDIKYHCIDYGQDKRKSPLRPKNTSCNNLLIFLKVSEIPGANQPTHGCRNWGWTGMCKGPKISAHSICPPHR